MCSVACLCGCAMCVVRFGGLHDVAIAVCCCLIGAVVYAGFVVAVLCVVVWCISSWCYCFFVA